MQDWEIKFREIMDRSDMRFSDVITIHEIFSSLKNKADKSDNQVRDLAYNLSAITTQKFGQYVLILRDKKNFTHFLPMNETPPFIFRYPVPKITSFDRFSVVSLPTEFPEILEFRLTDKNGFVFWYEQN